MGVFDNIKNKAEELLGDNSDKVEQHSDQGLDTAAERANAATGDKYADHVETGRSAIDDRIGDQGHTDPVDGDPVGGDPDAVDAERNNPDAVDPLR